MSFLKKHLKKAVYPFILFQIICGTKDFLSVYAFSYAIEAVVNNDTIQASVLLLVFTMAFFVGVILSDTFFKEKLLLKLRSDLLRSYKNKIMRLELCGLEDLDRGKILSSYTGDMNKICDWLQWTLSRMIQLVTYFLLAFFFCLGKSIPLTAVLAVLVAVIMPLVMKLVGKLDLDVRKERCCSDTIIKRVCETVQCMETLRVFDLSGRRQKKVLEEIDQKYEIDLKISTVKGAAKTMSFAAGYLPGIAAAIVGGYFYVEGKITIAFLLAFVQIVMGRVSMFFPQISEFFSSEKEVKVYMDRIDGFLGMPEETDQGDVGNHDDSPLLSFHDVSFKGTDGNPILSHISFCVNEGEKIAVVGYSGSGKTTLLKLIMGFYNHAYGGNILFRNLEIRNWNQNALREQIAPVFQNDFVFENERLSGGQIQNKLLERAMTKMSSELILLDEPMANLDNATAEKNARKLLNSHYKKTVIWTEHRLPLVKDSDRIIVLDHGRIAEIGTHKELLEKKGLYHHLYQKQAKEWEKAICV